MSGKLLSNLLNPQSDNDLAIIIPGKWSISYKDYSTQIELVSRLLTGNGLSRGDTVSIVLHNGLEFMILFLAITHAGGVAAPLNPNYTAAEFEFYMKDGGSKFVVIPNSKSAATTAATNLNIPILATSFISGNLTIARGGTKLSKLLDPATPSEDDTALFLHTSGTTSRPKGVPLKHRNLMESISNIVKHYSLNFEDRSMVVMPLFHVHGLIGASLSTLMSGGTLIIPQKFSASTFWTDVKTHGATWYSAVPTIHQVLLLRADEDKAPHESFKFIRSCSAALAPTILDNLETRFGAPVLEAYGMTEASHQMSSNPLPPQSRKPGTVGIPTGVEIAIMDSNNPGKFLGSGNKGEVVIKGKNVMKGYNNNRSANEEAFVNDWFRTGDQGIIDKDNYLTITGRLKELINRAGEKISPLEVDAALLKHESVVEAVSFAVNDAKYGECVHAAVVLNERTVDSESIRTHCAGILAEFKIPDVIHITHNLPRTATGKIQRRHVAATFSKTPS